LIRHRDGIAGPWGHATFTGPDLPLETDSNLERWEPWVRAAVLDDEMLMHLHFTRHPLTISGVTHTAFTLWHLTTTDVNPATVSASKLVSMIRPPETTFNQQLDLVDGYSDLREDRASEILTQMVPQHAFWSSVVMLHPDRNKWTLELLATALRLANLVEMRFKQALACRRPAERSPQIQPIILTPGHGSFPSGHATEAHIVARVLYQLTHASIAPTAAAKQALREQLMRQAARIAINRTVAGMHYPVDSAAGQLLGLTLAEYFIARFATAGGGAFSAWTFNGTQFGGSADFDFRQQYDTSTEIRNPALPYAIQDAGTTNAGASPYLNWLWVKAAGEWT
jgi:membrane-associated phospholipid phosphatase